MPEPTRYFATEQAEKAAKWDMLQKRKVARSHLAALEHEAEKLSEALKHFGSVLENPSWELTATNEKIIARPTLAPKGEANLVELRREQLDWDRITALVEDLRATRGQIQNLSAKLDFAD